MTTEERAEKIDNEYWEKINVEPRSHFIAFIKDEIGSAVLEAEQEWKKATAIVVRLSRQEARAEALEDAAKVVECLEFTDKTYEWRHDAVINIRALKARESEERK